MNIISVSSFYNKFATSYHEIFKNWDKSITYHSKCISTIIKKYFNNIENNEISILDCSCGIGTQIIGLAKMGYNVSGSDLSKNEIKRARKEAKKRNVEINFKICDFRNLSSLFSDQFDIVISFDNSLPHLIDKPDLNITFNEIFKILKPNGMFFASIRDYDQILLSKNTITEPYYHIDEKGKRISFQTWDWIEDTYTLTQYLIKHKNKFCKIKSFSTKYRAITREEISLKLHANNFSEISWIMPEDSDYYQPIVIAKKLKE